MNQITSNKITPDESTRCPACGSTLQIWEERHEGPNIPPGGFTEIFTECPSGCELPEEMPL